MYKHLPPAVAKGSSRIQGSEKKRKQNSRLLPGITAPARRLDLMAYEAKKSKEKAYKIAINALRLKKYHAALPFLPPKNIQQRQRAHNNIVVRRTQVGESGIEVFESTTPIAMHRIEEYNGNRERSRRGK